MYPLTSPRVQVTVVEVPGRESQDFYTIIPSMNKRPINQAQRLTVTVMLVNSLK